MKMKIPEPVRTYVGTVDLDAQRKNSLMKLNSPNRKNSTLEPILEKKFNIGTHGKNLFSTRQLGRKISNTSARVVPINIR